MKPGGSDAGDSLNLSPYTLRLVYSNSFSSPQQITREEDFISKSAAGAWQRTGSPNPKAEWIAEGWGGAEVRNGKLRVAPYPFDDQGHLKSRKIKDWGQAFDSSILNRTPIKRFEKNRRIEGLPPSPILSFSQQTFCLNSKWIQAFQPAA